jgi:hypothetical protein
MGTLDEDQYTFFIISHSVPFRLRYVSDKSCRKYQNTQFIFSNFFKKKFFHVGDIVEIYGRAGLSTDDNIIRYMCFAC